jgi:hypothetical protein
VFKVRPHPHLAFWAYLFSVGIITRPIAQVNTRLPHRESATVVRGFLALTENILSASLILFLQGHACPIGRLLMSQFVTHLSSLLHTHSTSQIEGNWDASRSYVVGGMNTPFSVTQPYSISMPPFSDLPEVPPGAIIDHGTWT